MLRWVYPEGFLCKPESWHPRKHARPSRCPSTSTPPNRSKAATHRAVRMHSTTTPTMKIVMILYFSRSSSFMVLCQHSDSVNTYGACKCHGAKDTSQTCKVPHCKIVGSLICVTRTLSSKLVKHLVRPTCTPASAHACLQHSHRMHCMCTKGNERGSVLTRAPSAHIHLCCS